MDPVITLSPHEAVVPLVVICEHAGNAYPKDAKYLGLTKELFQTHIAYDIGAREVSIALADMLGGVCACGHYSRLLVDLNRASDDYCCVREISDQLIIPGNQGLSRHDFDARIAQYHEPFHKQTDDVIASVREKFDNGIVAIVNIHSFTPQLRGKSKRPWHAGILCNHDRRIGDALLAGFAVHYPQYQIGDNEPYSGMAAFNYTCRRHAITHGLPHVAIEISQGELSDAHGLNDKTVTRWAECLAELLRPIMETNTIMQPFHG
ncbi:MAG: N-formylglutamate amidohydrolase [Pseudomonadota bacterium]